MVHLYQVTLVVEHLIFLLELKMALSVIMESTLELLLFTSALPLFLPLFQALLLGLACLMEHGMALFLNVIMVG